MSLRKGNTLISGVGVDGVSPRASVSKSGSVSTLTVTDVNGTSSTEILDGGQIIQYPVMPTASSENVGAIVQYTGTTDSTYTNGYFYKCVSGGQAIPTYSWETISVQQTIAQFNIVEGCYTLFNSDDISTSGSLWKPILQDLYDNKKPFPVISISPQLNSTGLVYPTNHAFNLLQKPTQFTLDYFMLATNSYTVKRYRFDLTWAGDTITYVSITNTISNTYNFLNLYNTSYYMPTAPYNPATKQYVDSRAFTPSQIPDYATNRIQVLQNVGGVVMWTSTDNVRVYVDGASTVLNATQTFAQQGYNAIYSQDSYDPTTESPSTYSVLNTTPIMSTDYYTTCDPMSTGVEVNIDGVPVELDPNQTYSEQGYDPVYSQDWCAWDEDPSSYEISDSYPYAGADAYTYCDQEEQPPIYIDDVETALDITQTFAQQGYSVIYDQMDYDPNYETQADHNVTNDYPDPNWGYYYTTCDPMPQD